MKKSNHTSRSFFVEILVRIIILAVMIVVFLSVFFFTYFRSNTLSQIFDSNRNLITSVSHSTENTHINTTYYVQTLFQNLSTQRLMLYAQNKNEVLFDIRAIEKILSSNPYVHSIYIYNPKQDEYYLVGENSLIREGQIYDEEAMALWANKKTPLVIPLPRIIPRTEYLEDELINVYSYVIKDDLDAMSGVVVNLYEEALFSYEGTNSQNVYAYDDLMTIDYEGKIVGSETKGNFLEDVSEASYYNKITENEALSGYFIDELDGEKELITYVKNETLGWVFVNKTPQDHINSLIRQTVLVLSIIVFAVLLVVIGVAYMLSRRIYRPLGRLEDSLSKDKFEMPEEASSIKEIKSIADRYGHVHHEYQDYKRRNFYHEKNRFLQKVIRNAISSKQELKVKLDKYKVNLDVDRPSILFMLKIDNYSHNYKERFSKKDCLIYLYSLANITKEIVTKEFPMCETVDTGEDYMVVIMSLDETQYDSDQINTLIIELIKRIQEVFSQFINVKLSGFISEIATNLYVINEEFYMVENLTKYRLLKGHQCILTMDDVEMDVEEGAFLREKNIVSLLDAIKSSDYQQISDVYLSIFGSIEAYNPDTIILFAVYVNSMIMNTAHLIEKNANIKFDINFLEVSQQLMSCETIDEINHLFDDIFVEISGSRQFSKINKNVQHIQDYISNNYMFETLSSAEIAENMQLSQNYINRLFKKSCATSVTNYIKNIRLEKAAELLCVTDDSVDRILERIGWTTKEYFYNSFRKKYGITPGDYRIGNQK